MARRKRKLSNQPFQRELSAFANRRLLGKKITHLGHDVTWFYSPEVARMRSRLQRNVIAAQNKRKTRRAALGAALLLSEDNRSWHPNPVRPARSVGTSKAHRLSIGPATSPGRRRRAALKRPALTTPALNSWTFPTSRVVFQNRTKVAVCIRRKIRREVILAGGFGGGGRRRRPRRNINSSVGC